MYVFIHSADSVRASCMCQALAEELEADSKKCLLPKVYILTGVGARFFKIYEQHIFFPLVSAMKDICNIDWWVESWSCDSQGSLSKVLESGGTRRGHHTKICGQRYQEEGQHLQRAWGRDEFGELC